MRKNVEEVIEAVIERPYKLRKLTDGDLVPLLGLFRKIGLKDFKEVILKAVNGKPAAEIGVEVILNIGDVIISRLEGEAGEAVYSFYSSLSGIPVAEMKEMEFGTLPMMIYDSFAEVRNTSFFRVLSKLL